MSGLAQTFSIIGSVVGVVTLQTVWLGRLFDLQGRRISEHGERLDHGIGELGGRLDRRMERLEDRLHSMETGVLHEHGERLAALERRVA
jgi:hypothetical protein